MTSVIEDYMKGRGTLSEPSRVADQRHSGRSVTSAPAAASIKCAHMDSLKNIIRAAGLVPGCIISQKVGLRVLQAEWKKFADAKEAMQGVLATSVPKATVLQFLESTEAPGDTFTVLEYGDLCDVVIYRDPLMPHEIATEFATYVRDGIGFQHGMEVMREVWNTHSAFVELIDAQGQHFRKAPDGGLVPAAMLDSIIELGNAPLLVMEVGCANETWEALLDESRSWALHPNVRVVVIIKVLIKGNTAPRIWVSFAWRVSGTINILRPVSIGAGSQCTAAGMPAFQAQLRIPFIMPDTLPELDRLKPIIVDLFALRKNVFRVLRQNPSTFHPFPARARQKEQHEVTQQFCQQPSLKYVSDEGAITRQQMVTVRAPALQAV